MNGKDPRLERGRAGEEAARHYLLEKGYAILQANFRNRYGEIDIIARKSSIVAFVEVKSRCGRAFGAPYEAVGKRKQDQIRRMAAMWLAACRDPSVRNCVFRFDVISITMRGNREPVSLEHIEDAFR